MNIAARYFEEKERFGPLDEQVVVRINQKRGYSRTDHYELLDEDRYAFLGAISIRGNEDPADGVRPWGKETFFFYPKKIKVKSGLKFIGEVLDRPSIKHSVRVGLLQQVGIEAAADYVRKGSLDKYDLRIHANAAFISFIAPEVIPKAMRLFGSLYKRKIEIDAAMIPEVIYHECAHHYMNKVFKSSGSHLDEGFANYFASKISGLESLGDKAGKYIKGSAAKKKNKNISFSYEHELRLSDHLTGEFLYSLLLLLEEELNEVEEKLGEKVILNMLQVNSLGVNFLSQFSDIRYDFVSQLHRSIKNLVEDEGKRYLVRQKVYNLLTEVGI